MLNRYRKRAVAYARYSSNNQREESIDAQLRAIREYCTRNDIELIEVYTDEAKTGTNDDRDNFQQMINDINGGQIDVDMVLVHKFNRFARSTFDSAVYKKKLKDQGVRVVSVTQNIEDTPEGEMMEKIIEAFDEYYSKNLSAEVKKGFRETAIQGRHNGGKITFGLKIDENGFYAPDENADIVRRIFTEYATGVPRAVICKQLNREGLKNQYGRPFEVRTMLYMLKNEKYIGTYSFTINFPNGKKEVIKHTKHIEPIIDDDLFNTVQKLIKNKSKPRLMPKARYHLSGIMFCGICGSRIASGSTTHTKHYAIRYYRCCGKSELKKNCTARNVNKLWIETNVIKTVCNYVMTDEYINAVTADVMRQLNDAREKPQKSTEELRKELKVIKAEQKRLTGLYMKEKITEELFDEENEPLTDRHDEIQNEIKKREAAEGIDDLSKEGIYNYVSDYVKQVTTSVLPDDDDFKRAIINEFVQKVVVDNDNVTVFIYTDFSTAEKRDKDQIAGAIYRLSLPQYTRAIHRPKGNLNMLKV